MAVPKHAYCLQVFKPPKLRKAAASDDGDAMGETLPVDSKDVLTTTRSFNNLAQRNGQSQHNNARSGSQYPSQAHVQQRY